MNCELGLAGIPRSLWKIHKHEWGRWYHAEER